MGTSEIVAILRRGPHKARFVSELDHQLRQANFGPGDLERDLAELETSGHALVRQQYCGDPHLEGIDLRIVALVEADPKRGDADPLATAVARIDSVWGRWLTEYLANHRCG